MWKASQKPSTLVRPCLQNGQRQTSKGTLVQFEVAYAGSVVALTGFWWFVVVYGGLWCFMSIRVGSVAALGGLWWFVVVYGGR